jgi:hypothetical protein
MFTDFLYGPNLKILVSKTIYLMITELEEYNDKYLDDYLEDAI